jgi:large subunit ribosomal protein L35
VGTPPVDFAAQDDRSITDFAPPEMERNMKQKLKTHTAMAKRVRVTGSGRFVRRKVAISHLRRNKSPRLVRSADKTVGLATADTRRLKRLLPYSF